MSLSNKALLAVLSISQWTGRKLDKRATETVETSHVTEKRVGNFNKKLLPGARELEEIQRHANSIRTFFYAQSLPWYSDGSRIISAKNYLDFTNDFRKRKESFDAAVSEFLACYPMLREAARQKLGGLFNETEYPTEARLASCFNCEISFMPLPDVSDFRVDILETEKAEFLNKIKQVETQAVQECWTRLYDTVSKAAVRLSDPDARLHESLIDNMTEIVQLLPKLNITDDPALETMRQSVEKTILGMSAERCRNNPVVRKESADKLAEITDKMSAFMAA